MASFLFAVAMTSLSGVFTRIFCTDTTSQVYQLTFLLFLTNPFAMFLSGIAPILGAFGIWLSYITNGIIVAAVIMRGYLWKRWRVM